MEPTVTVETITIWQLISYSGTFGVIALPISTLMLLGGVIGLFFNKTKRKFYLWILGTVIKFNLLSCALIFTSGISKFWMLIRDSSGPYMPNTFIAIFGELMGGIFILLFIAFVAFIIKTIAEVKMKLSANQNIEPTLKTPAE